MKLPKQASPSNSDMSEGDLSGGGTLEVNISGEADGMHMYMRSLPLFNIALKEFQSSIGNLENQNY